jgi:hypothetical protein
MLRPSAATTAPARAAIQFAVFVPVVIVGVAPLSPGRSGSRLDRRLTRLDRDDGERLLHRSVGLIIDQVGIR